MFLQHEFPNFQVDVYVLVLQNDGSALAAAINCAGLALADASVPMYDLVSAASLVSKNLIHFRFVLSKQQVNFVKRLKCYILCSLPRPHFVPTIPLISELQENLNNLNLFNPANNLNRELVNRDRLTIFKFSKIR